MRRLLRHIRWSRVVVVMMTVVLTIIVGYNLALSMMP